MITSSLWPSSAPYCARKAQQGNGKYFWVWSLSKKNPLSFLALFLSKKKKRNLGNAQNKRCFCPGSFPLWLSSTVILRNDLFMQLFTGMTFFYATDRVVCPPLVLSLTWKAANHLNVVLGGWSYLPKTRKAVAPSLVSRPPWSLQPPPAGSKCSFVEDGSITEKR